MRARESVTDDHALKRHQRPRAAVDRDEFAQRRGQRVGQIHVRADASTRRPRPDARFVPAQLRHDKPGTTRADSRHHPPPASAAPRQKASRRSAT